MPQGKTDLEALRQRIQSIEAGEVRTGEDSTGAGRRPADPSSVPPENVPRPGPPPSWAVDPDASPDEVADAASDAMDSARGSRRRGSKRGQVDALGESTLESDPYTFIHAMALRLLTHAPRTAKELTDRLVQKGAPQETAAQVVDRLIEVNLLDDEAFAFGWVRSRSRSKKLAGSALRRELAMKGVAPEIVDAALEELTRDDELEAARELVEKKLASSRGLERQKRVRRLVSMLQRKGYSPGIAFEVVNRALEQE